MLWALVMAGGRGTRLWPLVDAKTPKPLLKILPRSKTLLEETLFRISPVIAPERTLMIGSFEHLPFLRKHAPELLHHQIIGEPVPRNTAPTVALAASLISKQDPEALLLVLPADHWIKPPEKFHEAVRIAAERSRKEKAFTIFGVQPTFTSVSYGYLVPGKKMGRSCYKLNSFVEKPKENVARTMIQAGALWHAGIFMAPVKTILDAVRCHAPVLASKIRKLRVEEGKVVPEKVFRSLLDISIDYAIFEKLKHAFLVKGEFDWCDVGTWKSFETLWPHDRLKNAALGAYFAFDSRRNVIYSQDKPVCIYGVNDLVVVNTPHALLVTRKDCAESVRHVANAVSRKRSTRRG